LFQIPILMLEQELNWKYQSRYKKEEWIQEVQLGQESSLQMIEQEGSLQVLGGEKVQMQVPEVEKVERQVPEVE
jgi:hypothetical protein